MAKKQNFACVCRGKKIDLKKKPAENIFLLKFWPRNKIMCVRRERGKIMNGNEANKILVGKAIKGKLFSLSLSHFPLKNDDYNDGGGGDGYTGGGKSQRYSIRIRFLAKIFLFAWLLGKIYSQLMSSSKKKEEKHFFSFSSITKGAKERERSSSERERKLFP
jgi:hypothetical protein